MTAHPDPERIWLEPRVDGVPTDRAWADSDVWAELDDPALVPTEYVRADLVPIWVRDAVRNKLAHAELAVNVLNKAKRIQRAIAALNEAPDAGNRGATKREVEAIVDANQRAWAILTEGMDPPSLRRTEDAP